MEEKILSVKQKLADCISQLSEVSWMFSKQPGTYFTQDRKLPFPKVISALLSMEGGSLTSELLKYFGCSAEVASSSAFVQQRNKMTRETFPMLFSLFVKKTNVPKLYKGYRLIAADGSDIHIPTNPGDPDSYFPGIYGQGSYNMLHLDAMYDLLRHTYTDAALVGQRKVNERNTLCSMIDCSSMQNVLLIADRGYEGFNLMAHLQEKQWYFLIRIQDILHSRGIAAGLTLPDKDEFDVPIHLSLTTKASNEVKRLCEDKNKYR